MPDETLLRAAHRSLCITWGTTASYRLNAIRLERIGFASIPVLTVPVVCKPRDLSALIPISRQAAFAYLAERGVSDEGIAFRPTVQSHYRQQRFLDAAGARKMGVLHEIHYEMTPLLRAAVTWRYDRGELKAGWEMAS